MGQIIPYIDPIDPIAVASANPPTFIEGQRAFLSMDLNGNTRTTSSGSGSGGAVTIADGADTAEGTTTDAAVVGDTSGTISAKLRGISKILNSVWDSVSGALVGRLIAYTSGGWSKYSFGALSTTVKAIKSSAVGQIGGYYFFNPNATIAYIQIFDVATAGAVTLGTTVPDLAFGIPAGAAANLEITLGLVFSNGIQIAATTTRTGNTATSSGVDVNFWYK